MDNQQAKLPEQTQGVGGSTGGLQFHKGIDYAVVMLPKQNTETALARLYGRDKEVTKYGNLFAASEVMFAALQEAETEVAEIKKNIIEVRAGAYQGIAHPRFDEESQKELARLEAMLGRIRLALSAAGGKG